MSPSSQSFGFQLAGPDAAQWTDGEDGTRIRDINEAKLFEVSTVSSWSAYPQTSVGVRALADAIGVDDNEMRAALVNLTADGGELSPEQRELIERAADSRVAHPHLNPDVAEMLAQVERAADRWGLVSPH